MTRLEQQVVEGRTWQPARGTRATGSRRDAARVALASALDGCRPDMRRAIEAVIVPRIGTVRRTAACPVIHLGLSDVEAFVALLLRNDSQASTIDLVVSLERHGVPLEEIYLGLFQPAARRIGELWGEDRCSFIDVTLALGQLQALLRVFEPCFQRRGLQPGERRKALLLSLPGDQHTFGLKMVAQFFRRAGWGVWSAPMPSLDRLRTALTQTDFAVVGFSASGENRLDALAAAIRTIRRQAHHRPIGVMVGGPLFVTHPHYADQVGADAVGRDATEALVKAETVLATAAGS